MNLRSGGTTPPVPGSGELLNAAATPSAVLRSEGCPLWALASSPDLSFGAFRLSQHPGEGLSGTPAAVRDSAGGSGAYLSTGLISAGGDNGRVYSWDLRTPNTPLWNSAGANRSELLLHAAVNPVGLPYCFTSFCY